MHFRPTLISALVFQGSLVALFTNLLPACSFAPAKNVKVFPRKTWVSEDPPSLQPKGLSIRPLFSRDDRGSEKTLEVDAKSGPPLDLLKRATKKDDVVNKDVADTTGMPDFSSLLQPLSQEKTASVLAESPEETSAIDVKTFAVGLGVILVTAVAAACSTFGLTVDDLILGAQAFASNPQASSKQLLDAVGNAGSAGPIYFGIVYFLAEILAIPATPLTMSAGFLFGTTNGVITVLIAATLAACFGFVVGKTVLRGPVENLLEENPKYAKLDKAIGEKGFPLLFLVRLTPIFPFSISNYVYGASSIRFPDYFWGTLLGFTPGTIAYVYTGQVGQALTTGEGSQPWYVYVGGLAILTAVLKLVTDVATGIVEAMDDEEAE